MMSKPRRRTRPSGHRARWESLESRLALSTIVGIDPAPGTLLSAPPTAIRIRFDAPIDPFSTGPNDVILESIAADGSVAPAFSTDQTPIEDLSDDGLTLTLPLGQALDPGHYRVVLSGQSLLAGEDGQWLANADGTDLDLSDFAVRRPAATLASAVDLGTVGTSLAVPGALDFAADPSAVQLYKFTLSAGHFWRLGAEVSAERDGSPLNSALTLFDASGRPIATDDVGRPDDPDDPFLFRGLAAGTYYLGVSGSGNLAGQPGGYDPVAGTLGAPAVGPGGPFTLHLAADTADLPGALIGFRMDRADPLDPAPTGFSLRFSTALDLGDSGADVFARSTSGVQVVDASGRSWPIAAVNYSAQKASISFLFRNRLPQGSYTIRLSADHPLVDLAGIAPVSPTMPRGVLATFAVAPDLRPRLADGSLAFLPTAIPAPPGPRPILSEDLGPLTPDRVLSGIDRSFTLAPGRSAVFRYVNLYDDYYKFTVQHDRDGLSIEIIGPDGETYCPCAGPSGVPNALVAHLATGEYLVRMTATGKGPIAVQLGFSIPAFGWDSLLANGLGQGPALNLRLVSTDGDAFPPTASPSMGTDGASDSAPATAGAPAGPGAVASLMGVIPGASMGGTASPAPRSPENTSSAPTTGTLVARGAASLAFEIGGVPVGRPSLDGEHVGAVGPGESSGAVALASAAPSPIGAGQGPGLSDSLRGGFGLVGLPPRRLLQPTDPTEPPAPIEDGSIASEAAPAPAAPDAKLGPAQHLERPAAEAVAATAGAVLEPARATHPEQLAGAIPPSRLSSNEPGEPETEGAASGLGPWIAGLVGIAAVGVRWMRRRQRMRTNAAAIARRHVPAPHAARARVRLGSKHELHG